MIYLTLLSAQSGSSNGIIVKTSNQPCPCVLYPLLNTKRAPSFLYTHNTDCFPCKEKNRTPSCVFIMVSCYAMPKREKIQLPTDSISGCCEVLILPFSSSITYIEPTVQNRFYMWRTFTCQCLEWLFYWSVGDLHMSILGVIFFSKIVVHLLK